MTPNFVSEITEHNRLPDLFCFRVRNKLISNKSRMLTFDLICVFARHINARVQTYSKNPGATSGFSVPQA